MGNKGAVAYVTGDDEEFHSAMRLLAAITTNSGRTVSSAIGAARQKCTQVLEYDGMVKKMHKYLTSKYKCRDTAEPPMTPLEYAGVLGADTAAAELTAAIKELEKSMQSLEAAEVGGGKAKKSKTFLQNLMKKDDYESRGTAAPEGLMAQQHAVQVSKEEVTTERVITAKARLQAFQEKRKK